MDLQTEKLLEKYWLGETTVKEERAIKAYFEKHADDSMEAQYFGNLKNNTEKEPLKSFVHPGMHRKRIWLSAAAAIIMGLVSIPVIMNIEKEPDRYAVEDPMHALEVTRVSLQMVSNGLNKGKTYSNELAKFNEAKQIIKKR
jgi:hypothetical protein